MQSTYVIQYTQFLVAGRIWNLLLKLTRGIDIDYMTSSPRRKVSQYGLNLDAKRQIIHFKFL